MQLKKPFSLNFVVSFAFLLASIGGLFHASTILDIILDYISIALFTWWIYDDFVDKRADYFIVATDKERRLNSAYSEKRFIVRAVNATEAWQFAVKSLDKDIDHEWRIWEITQV